jgi:hypothetical protein
MFMDELQQHQRVQRVVQSQQIIRSHEHLSIKYRKQTSFVNNVIVASTESTIITYEGDDENIRRFIDQFNRIQAIITQESAEEELTSVTDARRLVTWLLIYKCVFVPSSSCLLPYNLHLHIHFIGAVCRLIAEYNSIVSQRIHIESLLAHSSSKWVSELTSEWEKLWARWSEYGEQLDVIVGYVVPNKQAPKRNATPPPKKPNHNQPPTTSSSVRVVRSKFGEFI